MAEQTADHYIDEGYQARWVHGSLHYFQASHVRAWRAIPRHQVPTAVANRLDGWARVTRDAADTHRHPRRRPSLVQRTLKTLRAIFRRALVDTRK